MHEPEGQRRPRASRSPLRLAAAIGLVVSLLLVPVVFAGRAVLTDQVSTTSAAITSRLATGSSIVATASRSVATAIDKATAVAEAADAVADRLASPLVAGRGGEGDRRRGDFV